MRKNTSRVEIIKTRSIENRIKSNKNFGHDLRAIFYNKLGKQNPNIAINVVVGKTKWSLFIETVKKMALFLELT